MGYASGYCGISSWPEALYISGMSIVIIIEIEYVYDLARRVWFSVR